MKSEIKIPEEYINALPEDRKNAVSQLRETVLKNLPKGFVEEMSYGMLGYVVPHSLYPKGYHCNPKLPLPLINIGSQKKHISFHHLGIYADTKLLNWFTKEFPKHTTSKLDIGKGCIRFKKEEDIPFKLIGELVKKILVKDWITLYEKSFIK